MSEPRITVVIPTRERKDVLEKSLTTVTTQDYDNLDVVVSDNDSLDGTEDVVRSIRDARIKYINTGERLSMSKNWEFALSHVNDGWVTVIGDDDGLLPGALRRVAEITQSTGIDAIRSKVCRYAWPSTPDGTFGLLSVPLDSGTEVRNSKEWLERVLDGKAGYPELPMLYNGGFVKMSVLHDIKRRTGSFYRSVTPDVYSALSIASVIHRYIYSREPLAINGASKHSTGTSSFSKREENDESPAAKFQSERNVPFHRDLPLCSDGSYPPSIQVIIYESYLQSSGLRQEVADNIHPRQLEIIAATSGRHKDEINEWAKLFASAHGIDLAKVQHRASWRRVYLELALFPQRLAAAINTYHTIGTPDAPIRDVYEASVLAGKIKGNLANRLTAMRQLITRVFNGSGDT
jgi:Glycosyl transferase family 2